MNLNPLQKLLQSIGASGIKRASGLIDDVVRPRLLVDSQRTIQRSVGNIRDILEKARPNSKSQQEFSRLIEGPINFSRSLSPSVIRTNFENPTQRFLQEYAPTQRSVGASVVDNFASSGGGLFNRLKSMVTGESFLDDLQEYGNKRSPGAAYIPASLKPTSVPTAYPFDDPLALLQGQARYVQRQVQGGIGQAIGQVGNLYKKIPTAVNPFATRTPTTLLGKAGSIVNPFNPANAASSAVGIAAGTVLDATIPDNTRRNNEYYNLGLLTLAPSIPGKIAALGLLGTTVNASDEDALVRQSNAALRVGKNYTVNGIQYDYRTGRAINPPSDTFVPDRQNRLAAPPVDSGFMLAGTLNTGAGTLDQRRAIEERNYKTQLNNAKQQYATPDPMSPDFQGYPNELAARYGLEQAYGQELKQAGTLVPQLQEAGAGAGMTPENFAAWAKANPGLAVRLLSQGQRN